MVSLYMCSIVSDIVNNSSITGSCTAVIGEWPTTPVSEEGVGSLVSLLFSNIVRTGVKVVTMIVFVNQMLLMMAGDVERNPGPGKLLSVFDDLYILEITLFLFSDPLGPNDLRCVRTAVYSIHHKWYNIGLELNIPFTALDAIEANHRLTDKCLTEMLKQWLNCDSPPPSWSALVEALSSEPVGEKRLAGEIQTKYCATQEESVDQAEGNQSAGDPCVTCITQCHIIIQYNTPYLHAVL